MAWNYTRIDDHTAFTAAALNTPFAAARTAVNAVPANDIPDGAFRADHLASLVVDAKTAAIVSDTEHRYTCIQTAGVSTVRNYAPYPGYGSNNINQPSPNRTWHIITPDNTVAALELKVTFVPTINLTDTTIGGILVLANVAAKVIGQTFDNASNDAEDVYGLWTIFIYTPDGWYNIDRCERFRPANVDTVPAPNDWITTNEDVSIRTLIRATDIPAANKNVSAIAVACSVAHTDGHLSCDQGENDYAYVECQHGSLTALVLQSACTVL